LLHLSSAFCREQHPDAQLHLTPERSNLTLYRLSVEDGVYRNMKVSRATLASLLFAFLLAATLGLAAQDPSAPPANAPAQTTQPTRLTIEVTGGEKSLPVENASVYVKYIEQRALRKDKKLELNVKTNREGIAHVPEAPLGRVLIQIIADGWKTYGRWYDITDPQQVIKVRLEKPPKWY
jgi:hypothetical protein